MLHKHRRKQFAVATCFAAALGLAAQGFAQNENHSNQGDPQYREQGKEHRCSKGERHNPMNKIKRMMKKLDLDDAQKTAVKEIMEEARPTFKEYRSQMHEEKQYYRTLLIADELDNKALERSVEAQTELLRSMLLEGAAVRQEIFALLTPVQREKAREAMAKRRKHY